jgi:hypothetical protein
MGKTSPEIRKRVRQLGLRIAELRASGASRHPLLSAALADLQAEQAVWKLLLATRRLQLREKVVNLTWWRDGFAAREPETVAPMTQPIAKNGTTIGGSRVR